MDFSFNIIFLLVFHIMTSVAVSKDCKARGIIKKDLYVILTFFFHVIAIVYGTKRKKLTRDVKWGRTGELYDINGTH